MFIMPVKKPQINESIDSVLLDHGADSHIGYN